MERPRFDVNDSGSNTKCARGHYQMKNTTGRRRKQHEPQVAEVRKVPTSGGLRQAMLSAPGADRAAQLRRPEIANVTLVLTAQYCGYLVLRAATIP